MEHISVLTIKMRPLSIGDSQGRFSYALGPYLQGALYEKSDSRYVKWLHEQPFNPYSQYCFWDKNEQLLIWKINALNDEAARFLLEPLLSLDEMHLRSANASFSILEKNMVAVPITTLTDAIQSDTQEKTTVNIVTPASFKSGTRYVNIPSIHLVFQNLLMKYGQVYAGDKDVDAEAVDYIERHAIISSYRLRSSAFANVAAHDKRIPAFQGSLTISVKGPQHLIGLTRMLLRFGEYSGIGVKTALGMGGVICN